MKTYPTTVERLAELASRMEIMTTDGDTSQLTSDDIGDIYIWLLWAQGATSDTQLTEVGRTYMSGVHSIPEDKETPEVCECGQPKNSIRHSFTAASSVDAHQFKPIKD